MKRNSLKIIVLVVACSLLFSGIALGYESPFAFDDQVDFGGATITIVTHAGNPYGAFEEGGDYAGRLEEAKERYNIGAFDYIDVDYGDRADVMRSRLMAGDSEHDIWPYGSAGVLSLIADGMFYPVSEILDPSEYYDLLPPYMSAAAEILSFRGEKYAIESTPGFSTMKFIFWNKDLFEREGFPSLYELYQNDEWTWEVYENLAEQATKDTTGDGEIDQWGMGHMEPHQFLYSNAASVAAVEEGNHVFTLNREPGIYSYSKLAEWRDRGLIEGNWRQDPFQDGNVAMASLQFWQINWLDDSFEYGIVPLPKGPHKTDSYAFPVNETSNRFIPINAANPEGLLAVQNFLWRPEEWLGGTEDWIIDMAPDEVAYEVLINGLHGWEGEVYLYAPILGNYWHGDRPYGGAYNAIMDGEDPATALDEAAPAAQFELDQFFGQ